MNDMLSSAKFLNMPAKELAELDTLTEIDKIIASSIKQYITLFSKLPTHELLAEYTTIPLGNIEECYKKPAFQALTIQLGLPLFADVDTPDPNRILTLMQITVADAVLNYMDKRTLREKLKEFGIRPQTFRGWMANNKPFKEYITKRAGDDLDSLDYLVNVKLTELIEDGDLAAIKLVSELRGKLVSKVQVDLNIGLFMTKIIEVITSRVSDQTVVSLIAMDMEEIAREFAPHSLNRSS